MLEKRPICENFVFLLISAFTLKFGNYNNYLVDDF